MEEGSLEEAKKRTSPLKQNIFVKLGKFNKSFAIE